MVQQICLFMHDPWKPHLNELKRILWYIYGTLDHGLQIQVSSKDGLIAYSYADWGGCPHLIGRIQDTLFLLVIILYLGLLSIRTW